ncbi:hypothetical protein LTR95_000382 [Oleoguttula sp. CCFEE 5521]|uniref:Ras-domain-containing protein n=1 Tax=Cryoendolithus antarcticus TaxID=1507870 RepID=A0A1V8TM53_9PEZI|nr:hypothetical protein B0A48_03088 [Cryoendolithus antarcticus]
MADAGMQKISITVCGDGGCGKSSITLRLVRSQWTHEYDPTIEDSYSVTRTLAGTTYALSLTDTAGQEEYRSLWSSSNLSSDAFLLVYDITSTSSLAALDFYVNMLEVERDNRAELGRTQPVGIVVGNKCDLQGLREVSSREGVEWAKQRGFGFMETSAREMVNIEETFASIIRRVVEARKNAAAGIVPELPSSTARTTPLSPMPLDEKLAAEEAAAAEQGRSMGAKPRSRWKSMFEMLKCW